MIDRVSHNYAGYKDKINSSTLASYNKLTDSLKTAATTTNDLSACYKLLDKYRLFFYDKHLQLSGNLPAEINPSKENPDQPIQTLFTKKDVIEYFTRYKALLNPIEGIWKTDAYEIGVLYNKKNKRYEGVIFNAGNKSWKEGMLKFSSISKSKNDYTTDYIKGNFLKETTTTLVYKNFMEIDGFGVWQKIFPLVKDSITLAGYNINYGGPVQWRMLDNKTLYIRLKSCDIVNKSILDSLIKTNTKKLKTIPNWIVDFRGNEGGSTDVFLNLLPYFYTKPLIEKGDKHWMTRENTALLKKIVDENKSTFDPGTLAYLNKMIAFGETNTNGWYDGGADTTKYKEVLHYPKRIAVLSDKNNASSGETFLMTVKGLSNKAKIFGENSAGYLDYGDLLPYTFPCDKLTMSIPSRRSNYLDDGKKYSYIGFPPDVLIPMQTTDWIQFVFDYWKKK